jgi:hypothetical protein
MSVLGEEGLIKDRYEPIIREAQTILTLSYAFMIGIGMLFQYQKYSHFSINIFDYADILDFFVAPFADRAVFVFALLATLFPIVTFRFDNWWRRKSPKTYSWAWLRMDTRSWFERVRLLSFLFLFPYFLYFMALSYGDMREHSIRDSIPYELVFLDGQVVEGAFIGKTSDVLFLEVNGKTKIYPFSATVRSFGPKPVVKK